MEKVDWDSYWNKIVGTWVGLPDGSLHLIGECLSCEKEMYGVSTDGTIICSKCALGLDDKGYDVTWKEQQRRYKRVHSRGVPWI